ncbi:MAG: FAD-binding protein, partial [Arenicella sp.]|nr:FAD-binding protein [Arenicella sp.]
MAMDFDIVIIGSGAGGGMAALSLCEKGFKVGLVERGPVFDPRKDYVLNYMDWGLREDPLTQARVREQTIDRSYQTRYRLGQEYQQRNANTYYRVHGLGGSTLHYQGEAHRFPEHAFNGLNEFGWGIDWPINYADLAPWYQRTEHLLAVAGAVGNPFKADREAFPTPAHALSPRSKLLARSAQSIGMTLQPNTLALPSRSV